MTIRDCLQAFDVTGPTPQVDTDDSRRARGHEFLHPMWIQIVGRGVDITEDRLDLLPLEGVCRRHEGEGGHDHLAGHTHSAEQDFESNRAVARGHALPHADQLTYSLLECLHVGAVVGQPAAVEDVLDTFHQSGSVPDVWPPHVERAGEGRGTPEQSEAIDVVNRHWKTMRAGESLANPHQCGTALLQPVGIASGRRGEDTLLHHDARKSGRRRKLQRAREPARHDRPRVPGRDPARYNPHLDVSDLHVAIDATALCNPIQGGIARYTRSLVEALRDDSQLSTPVLLYRTSRWKHHASRPRFEGVSQRWTTDLPWPPHRGLHVIHDPDARAPRKRGAARVATLHDVFSLLSTHFSSSRFRRRKQGRYRTLVRDCQRIIAVSECTRRDFLTRFPECPEDRVVVIFHGVSPRFSRASDDHLERLRIRLELDRPYLLFVGELSARKNLVRTLEAFEQAGLDDHVLVLAGEPGHQHEEVEHAVSRLGNRARLVGRVSDDELPALYSGASALCFATLYEGFGLPILESMRCGTPVVTSTTGAAPDVAGGHAILVDPEDVESMSAGLEKAVGMDANDRDAACVHAEKFTWEACARATQAVYEEAAGL